jgi:cytidylate kinase
MKYRVLTVAREYGSGGGEIAAIIAKELGWRLIDKDLLTDISHREKVSASEVAAFDEKVDPWIHRITRSVWGVGADGISPVAPVDMFDAEKTAQLAKRTIQEAYKLGSCVIVGRGSQCVLKNKDDVFHVFIYASWEERVRKIRERRGPGKDVESIIRSVDAERSEYIRLHFRQNWLNPYLYDMMINSKGQNEKVARLVIGAMQLIPEPPFA